VVRFVGKRSGSGINSHYFVLGKETGDGIVIHKNWNGCTCNCLVRGNQHFATITILGKSIRRNMKEKRAEKRRRKRDEW
jgi:hypothetical protein